MVSCDPTSELTTKVIISVPTKAGVQHALQVLLNEYVKRHPYLSAAFLFVWARYPTSPFRFAFRIFIGWPWAFLHEIFRVGEEVVMQAIVPPKLMSEICFPVPTTKGVEYGLSTFYNEALVAHPYLCSVVLLTWATFPGFPFDAANNVFFAWPRAILRGLVSVRGLIWKGLAQTPSKKGKGLSLPLLAIRWGCALAALLVFCTLGAFAT